MSSTKKVLARLLAAAAAAGALAAAPATSHASLGWFSGVSSLGMGMQCGYGGPTGIGMNTDNSVSYLTDPQAGYPAVGDRYLMRILVGVVGPSCDGGLSDFNTELLLPAYTALAVDLGSSNPDDKVRCFYEGSSGQVSDVTNQTWSHPEKPQISGKLCDSTKVPVMGQYGYGLGYRIAPMGGMFWVDVPVVTDRALNGMAGAGNTTKMGAAISSGINSFVNPTQWVTVFDRAASIDYPADNTTAVTDTTARTKSQVNAWYRKGNVFVDLGTGASGDYQVSAGPFPIDGNYANYTVTQDWAQLTPGTQHHWRLRFVDDGGVTTAGAAKTFTTTGTAPSTPPAGGGSGGRKPAPGGGTTGGGTGTQTTPTSTTSTPTTTTTTTTTTTGTPSGDARVSGGEPSAAAAAVTIPKGAPTKTPPGGRAALAPGTRLRALTGAGAKVVVPCAKACTATATLKVDAATARRLGLGRKAITLATGRGAASRAGSLTIKLKAKGRAAKALRRAKALTATLSVTVDGAAQSLKVSLTR